MEARHPGSILTLVALTLRVYQYSLAPTGAVVELDRLLLGHVVLVVQWYAAQRDRAVARRVVVGHAEREPSVRRAGRERVRDRAGALAAAPG